MLFPIPNQQHQSTGRQTHTLSFGLTIMWTARTGWGWENLKAASNFKRLSWHHFETPCRSTHWAVLCGADERQYCQTMTTEMSTTAETVNPLHSSARSRWPNHLDKNQTLIIKVHACLHGQYILLSHPAGVENSPLKNFYSL